MLKIRNWLLVRKEGGIGLLELMLSLAIIAILLIMATRYYVITARSSKVNETLAIITSVKAGTAMIFDYSHELDKIQANLIDHKLIPAAYIKGADLIDAWGNTLTAAKDAQTKVKMTFSGLNEADCDLLTLRLAGAGGGVGGTCPALTYTFDVAGGS